MDKRYQVFVSSTYMDLRAERQEVIQALLELDCIPTAMEFFTAATDESWEVIRRVLDACDYYVLIVAGRYGSLTPEGISYTEKEYELALELNIPVLAFLHSDPNALPHGKSERSPELEEKLEAFRGRLSRHTWKAWTATAELGGLVSRAMVKVLKQHPRPGWIRADIALASEDLILKLGRAQQRISDLESELNAARVAPPPGTENLAQGNDTVELDYEATGKTSAYGREKWTDQFKLTWNRLFTYLLPEAIDEVSEELLRSTVVLAIRANAPLRNGATELLKISLFLDSWQRVKVQMLALGVLRKGTKRRPPSDTATYFQLTPYGETLMQRLVASTKS